MTIKLFITGTDTEIGKTYITVGLLKLFKQLGYSTIGLKPIASGFLRKNNLLYNEDALALQQASSIKLKYSDVNPFAFEPAIAPHIAAKLIGKSLSVNDIFLNLQHSINYPADVYIIEGVGGWHVPLNDVETMADFVLRFNIPVIIVVGIRLGCINHAILTYQSIKNMKIPVAGWVANHLFPDELVTSEIVLTLKNWLKLPFLGEVKLNEKPENHLNISSLISQT